MSKLIKLTDDHYIIVDDSEIKEGDWLYSFDNGLIVQANRGSADTINSKSLNGRGYGKITHSRQPLDMKITDEGIHLPDWSKVKPLSPRKVKELIGEVNEVEELAEKAWGNSLATKGHRIGFKYGYNQALEDNKEKKYTEEDMKECVMSILRDLNTHNEIDKPVNFVWTDSFKKHIQSLQPKTEWDVEIVDGKLKLK